MASAVVPTTNREQVNKADVTSPFGSCEVISGEDEGLKGKNALPANEGEGEQSSMKCFTSMIPPGGLVSTAFSLASICIGAGILGLPAAANSTGLVMTFVYPIIIYFLCVYSLYCLGAQMERHGFRSYEGMARALLGQPCLYFTGVLRVVNAFGAAVAQIIATGDIVSTILKGTDAPNFLKEKWGNRLLTFIMWLCFMLPLAIPREVNSLRYVSTISVFFVFYLMAVIVVHSCMNGLPENIKNVHVTGAPGDEGIHLFGTSNRAVEGPGVFTFAFLCHISVFEIYFGMAKPSAHRFTAYSAIAMGICLVLCVMTAFFGYLDFGRDVAGSVLLMYDPVKEPAILVGFVGLLVKLFASYALLAMTCRNGLCGIIGLDTEKLSFFKHCTIIGTISIIMLLCGLFIPNINTVFGFVGSVCGGFLAFILPSLFMMYGGNWSLSTVGWLHYIATYAVLSAGVALSVFGTGATIYGVAVGW